MSKKFLITLATLLVITVATAGAVLLTKGYTFSTGEKKVSTTGIISVTSVPDGASVYVDGHLTTATNTTISALPPKTYKIKILKDGFIPWEKEVEVKVGLVTEIKATLFPGLPTIYPLTYNGVVNPTISPDGQKLAFAVPTSTEVAHARQKGGIWVWTMSSQPIAFSRSGEPHQIVASANSLDFTKAKIRWSPDSKQILVTLYEGEVSSEANQRNFLLSSDQYTSLADLKDTTPTVESLLKSWQEDQSAKSEARLLTIDDPKMQKTASSSATLKWSPDETKIIIGSSLLLEDSPSLDSQTKQASVESKKTLLKGFKVYDLVTDKSYDLPEALNYQWLPDSRHIILTGEDKISISEFDGSNVAVIFGGSFATYAVFPWPDSSRLVILTSFNTPTASQPNLFGVNLK